MTMSRTVTLSVLEALSAGAYTTQDPANRWIKAQDPGPSWADAVANSRLTAVVRSAASKVE